jgi:hypothetical protein
MFKRILAVFAVAFLGFATYVGLQPATSVVSRTATIAAAPEMIFPHINTFKKWEGWSPWKDMDPDAKTTYEGPDAGVGSIMKWAGNDKVGEGALAITESDAAKRMAYRIDFKAPMSSTANGEFLLEPQQAGGTNVTWRMTSERGYVTTALGIDAQIGQMFDKGLKQLGTVAAAGTPPEPAAAAPAPAPPT